MTRRVDRLFSEALEDFRKTKDVAARFPSFPSKDDRALSRARDIASHVKTVKPAPSELMKSHGLTQRQAIHATASAEKAYGVGDKTGEGAEWHAQHIARALAHREAPGSGQPPGMRKGY